MIQRIQTVYFLVAALLVASTLFGTDLFAYQQAGEFHASAYKLVHGTEAVKKVDFWMLSLIQIIFALMIIFSFKMRHRQIFLGWILLVLNILSSGWIVLGAYAEPMNCTACKDAATDLSFGIVFFLHAAAFIFVFLGIRGVRKDKKTIDSLNRLR
ncbi:DUF4293 domain-containing protein [Fluviicola chungangensis]|uniref:DUF4293 family protein n=1 Tax=Fluviicola chungangensis TaxID=2597671 RepID=A0A556N7Q6_9FLAO|nr:DUF4293 domain-containing protein [Fluviicola chungangensis]TSJ48168.1 DUF4293 family protein [Fluviicola chungangensis]